LPAIAVVDLMAAWTVELATVHTTAQFHLDNVCDRHYFESTAACCRSRIVPGTLLSAFAALDADF